MSFSQISEKSLGMQVVLKVWMSGGSDEFVYLSSKGGCTNYIPIPVITICLSCFLWKLMLVAGKAHSKSLDCWNINLVVPISRAMRSNYVEGNIAYTAGSLTLTCRLVRHHCAHKNHCLFFSEALSVVENVSASSPITIQSFMSSPVTMKCRLFDELSLPHGRRSNWSLISVVSNTTA